MTLPSALAQDLVAATLAVGAEQRTPIAVVVVDAGGRVTAGARADGASWVNWDVATRKAVAAASLGAPTHTIREMADQDLLLAAALDGVQQVLVVPGGFPVEVGGAVVGGIGVAGGHYTQDQQIAEEALSTLSDS